jgi:hypothetical protein
MAVEESPERGGLFARVAGATPPWLVSMVVHMLLLLTLALLSTPAAPRHVEHLLSARHEAPEELDVLEDFDLAAIEVLDSSLLNTDALDIEPNLSDLDLPDDDMAQMAVELSEFGLEVAPRTDLLAHLGSITGTGLEGRSTSARAAAVRRYGGTPASEAAVARGLRWLAAHQYPDGSWRFDFRHAPGCGGRCRNAGTIRAPTGATGLALLPFLGAGQTHRQGEYRETVDRGLRFLVSQMQMTPGGGSLQSARIAGDRPHMSGNMYCHGVAATVLCEAYALTNDPKLRDPAQEAIRYIVNSQHPSKGGWGYHAVSNEPPTMSITGWQFMALKSGYLAYLTVPERTMRGVGHWLDLMSMEGGSQYGYRENNLVPGDAKRRNYATTAIGLLGRMYLGTPHHDPTLQGGVHTLATWGPHRTFLYYNYYATQVIFQYGGEPWQRWNPLMREMLIATQVRGGHEDGSWWDPFSQQHDWSNWAGRLYTTALAIATLEVYYRYMPIYQRHAVPGTAGPVADDFFVD